MLSHLPVTIQLFCLLETLSVVLVTTAGLAQSLPDPSSQQHSSALTEANAQSLPLQSDRPLIQNALPEQSLTSLSFSTRAADLSLIDSVDIFRIQANTASNNQPYTTTAEPTTAEPSPENSKQDVQDELADPTGEPLNVPIEVKPRQPFRFGIGSASGEPTTLRGATRRHSVYALSDTLSSPSLDAYVGVDLGRNQDLLLNVRGGPTIVGTDLSYAINPDFLPGVISINLMNQQARSPSFARGDRDVDLPNSDTPYVNRLGGGIEYYQEVTPEFEFAVGTNYQLVSVRDGIFSANVEPRDEEGNRLTASNDGQDLLLTLNAIGRYDTTDNRGFPTRGTRSRFGIDQSIPIGDASIAYTRFAGNLTQFIPLRPFGSEGYPHVLVLDAQAGTTLGDVPPYEAFNLGGASTVRGWNQGKLGTGQSFVQATAEYRFPLFSFTIARQDVGIGGAAFIDYGNDLGTANEVIGKPGEVRDKAGDGFGFGLGLHARTSIGLFRLELALNDEGGNQVIFTIGDRF